MENQNLFLPPAMRFIVELTTWIWLLLYNWLLLPLSLIFLALLNFPGDKKPTSEKGIGFEVPGIVRISIEFLSAILGIFAAYQIFNELGLIFQTVITVASFYLDRSRWLWMLGRAEIPDFVLYVHTKN